VNSLTVFLLLVIAILLGIIAYLLRTGRSKIRISLSNDIHDEIGSLLTRAAMKVELLRTKTKDQFSELKIVERDLREAVQSFRNILWVLKHEERSMGDLISRIQSTWDLYLMLPIFHFRLPTEPTAGSSAVRLN